MTATAKDSVRFGRKWQRPRERPFCPSLYPRAAGKAGCDPAELDQVTLKQPVAMMHEMRLRRKPFGHFFHVPVTKLGSPFVLYHIAHWYSAYSLKTP
jgi:hypothetical protein